MLFLYRNIITLFTCLCVVSIDQLLKAIVKHFAATHGAQYRICNILNIVEVHNPGVSFGLFGASELSKWIFIALACFIVYLLWQHYICAYEYEPRHSDAAFQKHAKLRMYSVGLITGGALSNVIDRLRFGAVFDFIDFHIAQHHYPAFNVADASICIGVGCLLLFEVLLYKYRGKV